MRRFEKVFLQIIKVGLWAIPALPLFISPSMLFPFITGKNFTFRIGIEIIFALWLWVAVRYPEYRPRLTALFKVVSIFVGIVFLADLLGPNPYRSFFSNYERMEGFMMLGHLYLYFLILTSVFRTRRDWTIFFHVTLATSLIVSYVALTQRLGWRRSLQGGFRVDSTIGNPTYLAAYLLFHIWLLCLLLRQWWEKAWLRVLYIVSLLFELAILYFTATRGAALALVAVGILFLVSLVLWWPRVFPNLPRGRAGAAVALVLFFLVPVVFWQLRTTSFVQSSEALSRLTNYSLKEGTVQARFLIWRMALEGVKERPILGWGQENFYLVFQKYFNPRLYDQEPWFDRSHNIIFDWLIHAGIFGLAGFLATLVVAGLVLVRSMRANRLAVWDGLVLLALFLTYVLQNLFVFDNLNTYLLLFAFLAYTHFSAGGAPDPNGGSIRVNPSRIRAPHYALAIALLVGIPYGVYAYNVKPILEGQSLIRVLRDYQTQAPMDQIVGGFRQALSYHTFGDTEVREQLSNVARGVIGNPRFTPDQQKEFMALTLEEMKILATHPARDVKHVLFYGALLSQSRALDPRYLEQAGPILEESIRLSPTKQAAYFELAQFYLSVGNVDRAVELLRTAWQFDKSYRDATVNFWSVAVLAKNPTATLLVRAEADLDRLSDENVRRVATAYQRVGDFRTALELYAVLLKKAPNVAQYHATYAALLQNAGRLAQARHEVGEAIRLDPSYESEGKQFLQMLGK